MRISSISSSSIKAPKISYQLKALLLHLRKQQKRIVRKNKIVREFELQKHTYTLKKIDHFDDDDDGTLH